MKFLYEIYVFFVMYDILFIIHRNPCGRWRFRQAKPTVLNESNLTNVNMNYIPEFNIL